MYTAQIGQISEITNKWELAQLLAGQAKAPEQILQSLFTGIMQGLEEVSQTKFECLMKERVWSLVFGLKLKNLKEVFILEFCEQILGGFKDQEVDNMIEEHKKLGAVKNTIYSSQLQTAFALQKKSILDTVVKKADSMTNEWIGEIADALKKEGIELPTLLD